MSIFHASERKEQGRAQGRIHKPSAAGGGEEQRAPVSPEASARWAAKAIAPEVLSSPITASEKEEPLSPFVQECLAIAQGQREAQKLSPAQWAAFCSRHQSRLWAEKLLRGRGWLTAKDLLERTKRNPSPRTQRSAEKKGKVTPQASLMSLVQLFHRLVQEGLCEEKMIPSPSGKTRTVWAWKWICEEPLDKEPQP